MTQLLSLELRRLLRERANAALLALLSCLLLASALASGCAAREWRATQQAAEWDWSGRHAAALEATRGGSAGEAGRMAAFHFARGGAPIAALPPLGGLVLATSAHAVLSPDARVPVESRHTDHRKNEAIINPLLMELGVPDFATTLVLLLPLAILAGCAGLLQQAREAGTWRLVLAQAHAPWRIYALALLLRGGSVYAIAATASCLAFALDPGSSLHALGSWCLALLAFCLLWTAMAGLLGLLPVSAAAALLGGLGLWILASYGLPALVSARLDAQVPVPSRLLAVAEVRAAQQDAELRTDELVARWYAQHPGTLPAGRTSHTWPVTFMPRYLEQERLVRPILAAFDEARVARARRAQSWFALVPGLALTMLADDLAGASPARLAAHARAVDAFEDAWRQHLLPPIMAYRALNEHDLRTLPRFEPARTIVPEPRPAISAMLLAALAAWCALALLRPSVGRP